MLKNGAGDPCAAGVRSDCIVLGGIVLCSTLPYLFSLGFYVDDWFYQAIFAHSASQHIGALLQALVAHDASVRVRPVQAIYLATAFKVFGRQPMGYHVAGSLIFSMVPVVIYLVLRELQIGRWPAFTIPLVYGLLPHDSAVRFWMSAQQAALSMIFAGLGVYGILRWRREGAGHSLGWLFVAILALVLSVLSYEVAVGLIVASLGAIGLYKRRAPSASSGRKWWQGVALAFLVLLLVVSVKMYLQTRILQHFLFLTRLGSLSRHALVEAVRFNFWTYGLHLPAVVVSLYRHGAVSWVALAVAGGLGVFASAYLWIRLGGCKIPGPRASLWLIVAGFVIFGLGYGLFFANPATNFSSAGIINRITIVSALGASCVLIGIVGIGCSLLKSDSARVRASAVATGVICGAYCLVVSGIGFFWGQASSQQSMVYGLVARNLRSVPKGSVVLLDGFCRFSGPGVVFGTDWDTTAALQLTLGDASLRSDVVSPDLRFGDTVRERTGSASEYAYGPDLFVYNVRRNTLTSLPSKDAALTYLSTINPTQGGGCPQGRIDDGAKVF